MKAILKDGRLKYQTQYKVIYDLEGNQQSTIGATEEQWTEWGFKEVVNAEPTETQILGEWVETDTQIIRTIVDKTPEAIAEELASRKVNLVRGYEEDTDNLIQAVVGDRKSVV